MTTKHVVSLTVAAFLYFLIALSSAFPTKAGVGDQEAKFTQVSCSLRIHAGTKDTWNFAVYNTNCSESDQGAARFFLIFNVDNALWFDEYNSTQYRTWNCSKGATVSLRYDIPGWNALKPISHDVRVELYWYTNGSARLEDTTSFTIAVTVHIPLQNIVATGYLAAYLIACFLLFSYNYMKGIEE